MYPDYNESFKYNLRYHILKFIPSPLYKYILVYKYKKQLKISPDFDYPLKLTEKIQWLKLNDKSNKKTFFADKLWIKKYIQNNLSALKFAKVYQTGYSFEDLDFENLPEKFVIKTNHAWKTNTYIFDKTNISAFKMKLLKKHYNKVLKIDYAYWSYYELHYKNIKPQIYAEELLINNNEPEILSDYEIYCFNGNPEFILYRQYTNEFEQSIYNTNWEKLNFSIEYGHKTKKESPAFLNKMVNYSKTLSKEFKFVRVDFFEVNNDIYFGEMTFTPYSGFIKFIPDIYDLYYGHKLII